MDWFTPKGLGVWGDGRLTVLGTEGYIELRKYVDIAGRPGGDHLFLVDGKGVQHMDCQAQALPYGSRLIHDILNRTETAMPQAHCFLGHRAGPEGRSHGNPRGSRMMSKKLRVAVVGLGVGKSHLQAYAKVAEQFEVKAVCDLDAAKASTAAGEFGVAWHTTQFNDLLASTELDIIDICTPPHTHRMLIEQALAAGFHVICEKPLVGSLADADAIATAQGTAKGTLFPIFQYRCGNGLQKLKHLQAKGFAHTPYLSTIETSWRRDADYYEVLWRGKWATEMGGCCLTQAVHAHDMLSYVNGPVKTVFAHLATRVNPIEVEDCAAISIGMANGSVATLSVTLGAAEEMSRLRFMFSDLTVESRSPEAYRPGMDPWHFKGKTDAIDAAIAAALADFKPAPEYFEGQFALIHACLVHKAPTPVTLHDARQSLELITAIYHSAETGTAVSLPIAKDHPKYSGWAPASGRFGK